MSTQTIQIYGNSWVLCPERAAFWLEKKILVLADPHFGKAGTFRAHGIPIPVGSTKDDLKRLSGLLMQYRPERLLILGDLLHAKPGNTPALRRKIKAWRRQFPALPISLVRGNHDRMSGLPPEEFQIDQLQLEMEVPPFRFVHEPRAFDSHYAICGHVHPALRLINGMERETLPCFYFGRSHGILPAYGSFTGTQSIQPQKGDRVFVIAEDEIVELPMGRESISRNSH
jgi:DNA ligase-associated metallophosphoesterase